MKENASNNVYKNDKEFLAIIGPFIEKEIEKNEKLKARINEISSRLNNELYNKNLIFVEGKSDKIILDKYIELMNKEKEYEVVEWNVVEQIKFQNTCYLGALTLKMIAHITIEH